MGTNNFNYENILGVIELDSEDADYNYMLVDDAETNVYNDIKKTYDEHKNITVFSMDEYKNDYPISRSYGGHLFAQIQIRMWNEQDVYIDLVSYHGYYADANIDYDVRVENYSWDSIDIDDFLNHPSVVKAIREVRNSISTYTVVAKKIAQFSNGNAVYERVKA